MDDRCAHCKRVPGTYVPSKRMVLCVECDSKPPVECFACGEVRDVGQRVRGADVVLCSPCYFVCVTLRARRTRRAKSQVVPHV